MGAQVLVTYEADTFIERLNTEVQLYVRLLLAGHATREEAAAWASRQLREVRPDLFETSPHGQLVEYALSRLVDDDWTPDDDFGAEMTDLLGRLRDAQNGNVRLP